MKAKPATPSAVTNRLCGRIAHGPSSGKLALVEVEGRGCYPVQHMMPLLETVSEVMPQPAPKTMVRRHRPETF